MDLKQIRYFLAVAQTLNFSQASELMGVSQPALSKAIQKLEEELGLLIYRDGKDTRLTGLAKKLQPEFEIIDAAERRAAEIARSYSNSADVELKIGLARSFGPKRFDRFILSFIEEFETTRISTHDVDDAEGHKAVLSGELDALLAPELKANPKITSIGLFSEPLMLAMTKTHRLASRPALRLEDLEGERFIDKVDCDYCEKFLGLARARGIDIDNKIIAHRDDLAQRLACEGRGVTLLTGSSLVTDELVLRPVAGLEMERHVCLHTVFGSCKPSVIGDLERFAANFDWSSPAYDETPAPLPFRAAIPA